ncbi:GDSL-type esterase/lipase family protein [Leptospira saintgironsiae]|uniref:GDSL-type esterase/lipase family protein n=1 Tax=Leptospira saintgironsiae TaxID=2023183 RepID=UPI001AD83753|nr:GDSL-type esterase/lipase family protein [Leptospira saintgironsiae]
MKLAKLILRLLPLFLILNGLELTAQPAPYKLVNPVRIRPFGDSITYGVQFAAGFPFCPVPAIGQYICSPPIAIGGGYRGWMALFSFEGDGIIFTTEGYQAGGSNTSQWISNTQTHDGYPGWTNEKLMPIAGLPSFSDITLVHSGTNDMWQILKIQNPTDAQIDQVASSAGASLFQLLNQLLANNPKAYVFVAKIIQVSAPQAPYNSFDYNTVNKVIFKYNNYISNNWINVPPANRARMALVDMSQVLQQGPDYSGDGVHPSGLGYMKIACTWIQAIKGQQPNPQAPCSGITDLSAVQKMTPSKSEAKQMTLPKEQFQKLFQGKPRSN